MTVQTPLSEPFAWAIHSPGNNNVSDFMKVTAELHAATRNKLAQLMTVAATLGPAVIGPVKSRKVKGYDSLWELRTSGDNPARLLYTYGTQDKTLVVLGVFAKQEEADSLLETQKVVRKGLSGAIGAADLTYLRVWQDAENKASGFQTVESREAALPKTATREQRAETSVPASSQASSHKRVRRFQPVEAEPARPAASKETSATKTPSATPDTAPDKLTTELNASTRGALDAYKDAQDKLSNAQEAHRDYQARREAALSRLHELTNNRAAEILSVREQANTVRAQAVRAYLYRDFRKRAALVAFLATVSVVAVSVFALTGITALATAGPTVIAAVHHVATARRRAQAAGQTIDETTKRWKETSELAVLKAFDEPIRRCEDTINEIDTTSKPIVQAQQDLTVSAKRFAEHVTNQRLASVEAALPSANAQALQAARGGGRKLTQVQQCIAEAVEFHDTFEIPHVEPLLGDSAKLNTEQRAQRTLLTEQIHKAQDLLGVEVGQGLAETVARDNIQRSPAAPTL